MLALYQLVAKALLWMSLTLYLSQTLVKVEWIPSTSCSEYEPRETTHEGPF